MMREVEGAEKLAVEKSQIAPAQVTAGYHCRMVRMLTQPRHARRRRQR